MKLQSKPDGVPVPSLKVSPVSGRRRFLRSLLSVGIVASAASFLYPVLKYLFPPATADLGSEGVVATKLGTLKPNSSLIFGFGSKPALLIMDVGGNFRALSATCTHLSCTVQYIQETQQIWCACHNGIYDLNGRNISGPPPRPLDVYDVHVRGEEIVVSRKRGS